MPRRPRLHLPDYPHHLIQRGRNRAACFFAEQDYRAYLQALRGALEKTGVCLHAYVLMSNHVHLLVTPKAAGDISRLMMTIGRRYAAHINACYGRLGPLWDSRYKSSLIDDEHYLLRCQQYIELNAVRFEKVSDPGDYPWSSYGGNALGADDPLLAPHDLYLALGESPRARQAAYRALFNTALSHRTMAEFRLAIQQSQPIGSEEFLQRIEQITGQRRQAQPRGRPLKMP